MRVLMFLTLGLTGCMATPRYAYRPAQVNGDSVAYPSAYYELAAGASKGSVRVASFGINIFRLPKGEDMVAVHVRLIVANDTDQRSWSMDPRSIRASFFVRGGEVGPAFVDVNGGPDGKVEIPLGARRNVDVFFPLPPGEEPVPGFEVRWLVETRSGPLGERTRFERMRVEDVSPYAADGYAGEPGPYGYGYYAFGSPVRLLPYASGYYADPPEDRRDVDESDSRFSYGSHSRPEGLGFYQYGWYGLGVYGRGGYGRGLIGGGHIGIGAHRW